MECKCLTKEGVRCSRMAEKGSNFCWQHRRNCRTAISKAKSGRRKKLGLEFMPDLIPDPAAANIRQFKRLSNLPPELVYNLCQTMDVETLKAFVLTDKRHHAICQPLLNKKIAKFATLTIRYAPVTVGQFLDLNKEWDVLRDNAIGKFWVLLPNGRFDRFKYHIEHKRASRRQLPLELNLSFEEYLPGIPDWVERMQHESFYLTAVGSPFENREDAIVCVKLGKGYYCPLWEKGNVPIAVARYWINFIDTI